MNITLYQSTAEKNRLNKADYLTVQATYSGTLREDCSVITPSVEVQSIGLPQGNYAYILEFNRYYFIREIVATNNGLWRLSLEVDVLYTYNAQIRTQTALFSRSNLGSKLLVDNYATENPIYEFVPWSVNTPVLSSNVLNDYPNNIDDCTVIIRVLKKINSGAWGTPSYEVPNSFEFSVPNGAISPIEGGNITTYLTSIANLSGLYRQLENDSQNSSYLLSAYVYPFKFGNLNDEISPTPPEGTRMVSITVGDKDFDGLWAYEVSSNYSGAITVGSFIHLNQFLNSYDENILYPETKIIFWLPFYGIYEFNHNEYLSRIKSGKAGSLNIKYVFDLLSNKCTIFLKDDEVVYETISVDAGIAVPFSNTNEDTVQRNKVADSINLVGRIIGSAGVSAVSVASAPINPLSLVGAAGGLGGIASGITGYMANRAKEVPYASNKFTPEAGYSLNTWGAYKCHVYLFRKTFLTVRDDNYISNVGLPDYNIRSLASMSGYAEVGIIHLENIPTALSEELEQIERLLKNGVHF